MATRLPLTSDQLAIRDATCRFAREVVKPRANERDELQEFPTEEVEGAAEIGLLGMTIPEEYGGFPLDAVSVALAYEEVARASASVSVILSVHNTLVSSAIAQFAKPAVHEKYLEDMAAGQRIGAYALTEPEAGSDAASIKTRAERVDGGFRLRGDKVFISSAGHAGVLVVFALSDPDARTSKRITAFVVDPDWDGVEIGPPEKKLGILASEICGIHFAGCFVPDDHVLGEIGDGFGVAMNALAAGRIGIASQAVGIAAAALDASRSYATTRKQFGQSISSFQAIQWKLADMATGLEAARLMVWNAARLKDAGLPYTTEASQAKLFASELAVRAANDAVQIHGGYGYLKSYGVERLYRDAKITEIYEGTSEIQRLVISRSVLQDEANRR
ncbi:MAG: acyl-CoA dehydrogenase family protein [Thermomicrobiales bacterium]